MIFILQHASDVCMQMHGTKTVHTTISEVMTRALLGSRRLQKVEGCCKHAIARYCWGYILNA
jgi:hypothetical protein